MLSPDRPNIASPLLPRYRTPGLSPANIAVLFAALTLLISIPIWTHPLPPLSDYEAANPDPTRLRLVADGDRFQLYRILKPKTVAAQ